MASASATPNLVTLSINSHPSPAPSPSSFSSSSSPTSPTSSASSQDSRKRKRDELPATPVLLISPPHSPPTEGVVHATTNMSIMPLLGSVWGSFKIFIGVGVLPSLPGEEVEGEALESPTKRVRVENPLEDEGPTPDNQTNKAEPTPAQIPNKEALRSQTNSRSGLKIKAPTSTDRQTPTQQLPSPLASSSEDEGESQFKKSISTRPIRPLPPRIAPARISANNGPLEQNELPFFAEPLHKKRDAKVVLQRALARRETHGDLGINYTPLTPRFPQHLQQNTGVYKGLTTPLPRSRIARECNFATGFSQVVFESMIIPETIRKPDVLGHSTNERPKRVTPKKRGIHKTIQDNYAKSQAWSQAENESLEVLLKQLIADKAEGFHSYAEVAKRRRERAKDVQRMREADTKVDKIPSLTPDQVKLIKKTIAEVERDSRLGSSRRYIEKFKIPISTPDLLRMRPDTWLNDEVINFYLNMIVERSKKAHPSEPQKILAHNTFFFPKLEAGGHKAVARWAKRLGVSGEGLLKLDYMFVPVHVARTHWCLAVANFKLKRFEYYDSLGGNFTPQRRSVYYAAMREYVEKETGKSCDDWIDFSMKGAPQQSNNSDCGVFTIKTAETIARGGKMSFSASDMPLIRQRAIVEVLRGELLPWVVED